MSPTYTIVAAAYEAYKKGKNLGMVENNAKILKPAYEAFKRAKVMEEGARSAGK